MSQKVDSEGDELRNSAQSPPSKNRSLALLSEILPTNGLVYSEKGALSEIMCKPKIMPIKPVLGSNLEEQAREAEEDAASANAAFS
mmetsp:Transcript_21117/g.54522  ORF Transcript_21117/g.54522 Transcript_21117/m.54522 type:complete len:86 (-) Transcript_21117:136-393(-)